MRHVLALAAVLALAPAPQPVALVFAPAAGTTLQRTWRSSYALEIEEMGMSFDGEELPAEYMEDLGGTMSGEETRVVTDVLEAVEGGRATRLVRRFDALDGKDVMAFDDEEPEESAATSALEGKRVVFRWNGEEEAHEVAFAEGEEGDEALLDGLEEDMDLRALLPDGEVEPGASWELEPTIYGTLIALGGEVGLLAEDEELLDDESSEELEENTDGTVRATFVEVREEGEARIAVVRLELEVTTFSDETLEEGGEDEEGFHDFGGSERTDLAVEASAELLWDLAHGHALSFELEGTLSMTITQDMRGEMEGESFEQSTSMVFRGPLTIALEIERR